MLEKAPHIKNLMEYFLFIRQSLVKTYTVEFIHDREYEDRKIIPPFIIFNFTYLNQSTERG